MVDLNTANSYKEVLVILNSLSKEDYERIPKEYIKFFEDNCNNSYVFEYDPTIDINEIQLLAKTKQILFGLFEKFSATEKQKAIIKSYRDNFNKRIEEEKRQRYNLENPFGKKTNI